MQTSTINTGTAGGKTTLEILKDIESALASMPVDPIKDFMKRNGADPDNGWVIILPNSFIDQFSNLFPLPSYVRFSRYATDSVYLVEMSLPPVREMMRMKFQLPIRKHSIINLENCV